MSSMYRNYRGWQLRILADTSDPPSPADSPPAAAGKWWFCCWRDCLRMERGQNRLEAATETDAWDKFRAMIDDRCAGEADDVEAGAARLSQ